MEKILIRKQFMECFRSYFVNNKTGKPNSKKSITGKFVLFGVLLLVLACSFFAMALGLADAFAGTEVEWMYFAIMGLISLLLGVFGSVFNTYASLYLSKDNELLLSMPIPPRAILLSRMSVVFGLSFIYSNIVWIPTCVCWLIFGNPTGLSVLFSLLLIIVISMLVTVITCALGWVVAAIAVRLKRKNIVVSILSVVLFLAYYMLCMRFSTIINKFIENQAAVAEGFKTWANFIYQLGQAADGNVLSMVIFTAITLVLSVLCVYLLSRSFISIVTKTAPAAKAEKVQTVSKGKTVSSALYSKELKRLVGTPIYFLNGALGSVLLPLIAIVMLFKSKDFFASAGPLMDAFPFIKDLLPLAVLVIVGMIMSMNVISAPSISLEGKTLWLLKSLPVSGSDVLFAKEKLHVSFCSIPAAVSVVLLGIAFKLDYPIMIEIVCVEILLSIFEADLGLMFGLKNPNFNWTNETQPIKQSTTILWVMLIGWLLVVLIAGAGYLTKDMIEMNQFVLALVVILAVAVRFTRRWLSTKGSELFDAL